MGLDISSASDKEYRYSYRGMHIIRYMAYQSTGGKLSFQEWYDDMAKDEATPLYIATRKKFPNLYWHSDCDGDYTLDGKVDPFDGHHTLQHGNSRELLSELEYVKENLKPIRPTDQLGSWESEDHRNGYLFYMFYDLVKDVVENHDGVIEFN